jgi:hypothetical protein
MPTKRKKRVRTSGVVKQTSGVPKIAALPPPPAPTFADSWVYFAFLFGTAVLAYYAMIPILIIAAVVALGWTCKRYPLFAWFLFVFVRTLIGRR